MRWLNDADARFFNQLENLESLEGVGLFSAIGKDPFDDHAGIEHDRHHGLPRLLAVRIVLSVTRRVRFLSANNCSTTLALRRRRRRSSTAYRMRSVNTALLFCRRNALLNASFTSDGTLKFTVAIADSIC